MGAVAALFWHTVHQTLFQRKIWPTLLLLAVPCAVILLIGQFDPQSGFWRRFHFPTILLLVSVVIPLVGMLYGTALIGSEVEGRTLVYLLTRRQRRATVLLVRFAATAIVLTLLLELGALAAFGCALRGPQIQVMTMEGVSKAVPLSWPPWGAVGCYLYVIPFATVAFLAVFAVIGLFFSRPLGVSIGYFVVVELITGNVPLRVQVYTISHYLRASLFQAEPGLIEFYEYPREIAEQLYPPGWTGISELVMIALGAFLVAAVLVTIRELVPAKITRE